MIEQNAAGDELERLDNQEFNLDQEAQDEFNQREEQLVHNLRESIEHEKNEYDTIVEKITKSCWSQLETGPRTLTGFGNAVEVANFHISPTPMEQANELETLLAKRKVQLEEEEIRNQRRAKETPSQEDIDAKAEEEEGISTTGTLSDELINPDPHLRSQFKVNTWYTHTVHS